MNFNTESACLFVRMLYNVARNKITNLHINHETELPQKEKKDNKFTCNPCEIDYS